MQKTITRPKVFFLWSLLLALTPMLRAQPRFTPDLFADQPENAPVVVQGAGMNCNRDSIIKDYKLSIDSTAVSNAQLNWTGDVATCMPGTISSLAMQRTFTRINYFRRLVGVKDSVTMRADWSAKCQQAALMMKANNMLSHSPPTSWLCYTADGAEAAGKSNISIGGHSSASVNQYIQDAGSNNTAVGHRRWILYTRSKEFGFGSTNNTTAMWVIGGFQNPDTLPAFIAYPSPGYFPKPLVYQRWSFAVPSGNFTNATVQMFDENDVPYTVTLEPLATGFGDNTIVWTANYGTLPPVADKLFKVKVNNVVVSGQTKNYEYSVLAINTTYQDIQASTISPTCGQPTGSIKVSYAPGYKKIEWNNGVVDQDSIFGLTPGTYIATVTDKLGCMKMDTIELLDSSTPASADITHPGDLNICPNEQLELTATGGVTYKWNTTATTPAITVNVGGSYTVTVTNSFGCTDEATVAVVLGSGAPASIAPAGATQFCQGQSVELVASGGVSYLWSTGDSSATINVSTPGNFTVTATNALGCTGTAVQDIAVEPNPAVAINPSGLVQICPGESVQLTANGGTSYLWSNGVAGAVLSVNTSGSFTVTATSAFGCTASITQAVVVQANLSVTIAPSGSAEICAGQSLELTASGGDTYQWSTGAGSAAISINTAGNFTVTATNAFGCTGTATQSVVVHSNPVASISATGSTELCPGQSVQLTAAGGSTYSWSTGAGNAAITVNTSGDFTVTATNNFGCTATATQPVVVHPNPAVSINPSGPTTFCAGQTVQLSATGGETYKWSTTAGTPAITVTNAGIYTVTATSAFGCTSSAIQVVVVNAAPVVSIAASGPTEFCAGQSVQLTAGGGVAYQWSTGATGAGINVSSTGNFTVTATNAAGCTSSATQNVVAYSDIAVTITPSGPTQFCAGQVLNLTATGGNTYQWSNGATSPGLNVSTSGTYTVTATNAIGCTATASQTVVVLPKPTVWIAASGPTQLCQGQQLNLIAIGTDTYLWSTGFGGKLIEVNTAGSYTVTATNAAGCTSTASQLVTVQPAPTVSIAPTVPVTFCTGGSAQLTANSTGTFAWSTGATGASITVTTAGTYTVTVSNAAGCAASATKTVEVLGAPTAVISPAGTLDICAGQTGMLTAGGDGTYKWSTGATGATLTVSTSGTYSVTVTNPSGCTATASKQVTLHPNPVITAFTGDEMAFNNQTELYTVTANVSQYVWQVTGGTITNGTNTNAVTVLWGDADNGQVCIKGIDNFGCKTEQLCKEVELEVFVGAGEVADKARLEVAPNPFGSTVRLRLVGDAGAADRYQVKLYNSQGRLVFDDRFAVAEIDLELEHLAAGLYFIEVYTGNQRYLTKVVKE